MQRAPIRTKLNSHIIIAAFNYSKKKFCLAALSRAFDIEL